MNQLAKNFVFFLTVIFIGLSFYALIILLSAPANLIEQLELVSTEKSAIVEDVFFPLSITLGITLFLAFAIVFILLINSYNRKFAQATHTEPDLKEANNNIDGMSAPEQALQPDKAQGSAEKLYRELQSHEENEHSSFFGLLLNRLCHEVEAGAGVLYLKNTSGIFEAKELFAFSFEEKQPLSFKEGEGLVGQVIKTGKTLQVPKIPEGYAKIKTGLGSTSPKSLVILPYFSGGEMKAIIEIAMLSDLSAQKVNYLENTLALLSTRSVVN